MKLIVICLFAVLVTAPSAKTFASASGQARAHAECHFCHDNPPRNAPPTGFAVFQRDGNPFSPPGERDRYIVRISGGNARAGGFALWASEGFLEPDPASPNPTEQIRERFQGDQYFELTHSRRGNANGDGNVEWWVFWTPPEDGADEALLVASGISANGNGGSSGDITVHVERTIPIECPDSDRDGFLLDDCGGNDCDDTRGAINIDGNEVCNGRDDNCDGRTDEGFVLEACPLQAGVCEGAREICNDNGRQNCVDATYGEGFERNEISCDGTDNDCDGTVDELLAAPLGTCQVNGVCADSTPRCIGRGGWTCENPLTYEVNETRCDELDNDCDGQTDENCNCQEGESRDCGSDNGVCTAGRQSCDDGRWGTCVGEVLGRPEQCDGLDNDCNDNVDDNLPGRDCDLRVGVCAGTSPRCDGAQGWLPCGPIEYGLDYELSETLCDGLDNDCDGIVDDGCPGVEQPGEGGDEGGDEGPDVDELCTPGTAKPCGGTSTGECSLSVKVCEQDRTYGACQGGIAAKAELCGDGKDNDCDGETDEDSVLDACIRAGAGEGDEGKGDDNGGEEVEGTPGPGREDLTEDEGGGGGLCAAAPSTHVDHGLTLRALLRR